MKRLKRLALILPLFSGMGTAGLPPPVQLPASLETRLARLSAEWNVPGMAVGILSGDTVLLARGYGVRTAGGRDSVNEQTLFAIASLTKAFTAAAIAHLVDRGRIGWDDPVQRHLPWFQMYDPWVSREMTVRDLLCHRSGLHTFGGDLLWYGTTYSREEVVRRIRFLRPRHGFRASYGYQNIMFVAAGEVVEEVTGRSWDEFVSDSIFVPLGMTRSTTRVRDLTGIPNVASPHIERDGKMIPVPYRDVDNAGPAAAVNSSVSDLLRWARMWLRPEDTGAPGVVSSRARHDLWSPHTPVRLSRRALEQIPERHFYVAGLGWFLSDYAGKKIVSHGGAMDGMLSQLTLVPEEGYAIVLLTNSDTAPIGPLTYTILDALLGRPATHWLEEEQRSRKAANARRAAARAEETARRAIDTRSSLPIGRYNGVYRSEMYGDVRVEATGKALIVSFVPTPGFVADLSHWHYDTFRIDLRDPVMPDGYATFVLDARGVPSELRIDIPNPDFDFTELELKRVESEK
jgi:CubicO group peptidase (beta-lactamase class C family)